MFLFGLRRGEVTTREIVLDDICARFQSIQYLVRAGTTAAIDAAILCGTLVETDGHLRTGDSSTIWKLDIEMPIDDESACGYTQHPRRASPGSPHFSRSSPR